MSPVEPGWWRSMDEFRDLLSTVIGRPELEERYRQRRDRYSELRAFVPATVDKVVIADAPLACHGLGWRMATWSSENPLARLNGLIGRAKSACGWRREGRNWRHDALRDVDRFHQLLWMLLCFEFFADAGADVEFAANDRAAPDLRVSSALCSQGWFHVECYFFTKWWGHETFLFDLLRMIDPKLRVIRQLAIHDIQACRSGTSG